MADDVARNTFTTHRGLLDYQRVLGPEFTAFLAGLGPEQHWVDAGAGQALAAREYLESDLFPSKARVTAVAVVPPDPASIAGLEQRFPHFRYLAGRPIEEIPAEAIGPADLITDVYGPLQYARQIDLVIEQYGRLLRTGGRLWTVLPAITSIIDRDTERPLSQWLAAARGFTALRLPVEGSHALEVVMARNDEPVRVPRLVLTRVTPGPPPQREYRLLRRRRRRRQPPSSGNA